MENQKAMGKLERAGGMEEVGTLMGRQVKELQRSILRNGIGQKGERGKKRRESLGKPGKGKGEKWKGTGKEKGGWKDRKEVVRGKQGRRAHRERG